MVLSDNLIFEKVAITFSSYVNNTYAVINSVMSPVLGAGANSGKRSNTECVKGESCMA